MAPGARHLDTGGLEGDSRERLRLLTLAVAIRASGLTRDGRP